jgi:hypothetical protein
MQSIVAISISILIATNLFQLQATTLARMSLDQLAHAADAIVRARCTSVSTRWESGNIWTFDEFERIEPLKGNPPARFQVRLPGGRIGNISTRIEEVPKFLPGDDVLIFLESRRDGTYAVTAWSEGTFRIRKGTAASPELVTQDSSGALVFDPVTRQFHSEGIRNLPWTELHKRLLDALSSAKTGATR